MPKQDRNTPRSNIRVLRFSGPEAAVPQMQSSDDALADAIRKAWTRNKPSLAQNAVSAHPPLSRNEMSGEERPAS